MRIWECLLELLRSFVFAIFGMRESFREGDSFIVFFYHGGKVYSARLKYSDEDFLSGRPEHFRSGGETYRRLRGVLDREE